MIFFRIVHVGSAMMWFGGAIIGGFFLQPTAKALGTAGQPFMDHLMKRRGMGIFFPIVAALAIISGAALYWHDSGGLQRAWITSPTGLAFTIGGLAALVAFVGGLVLIGRASPSRRRCRRSSPTATASRPPTSIGGSRGLRGGCGFRPGSTSRCSSSPG